MKSNFHLFRVFYAFLLFSNLALASGSPELFTDVQKYNAEQKRRAQNFYIDKKPQQGETCVCQVQKNIAIALTGNIRAGDKYLEGCNGRQYFFFNIRDTRKTYPGELFGHFSFHWTHPDKALEKIFQAIDDGKIVAVALNAEPIYDEYSKNHNIDHTTSGSEVINGKGHAIVVIGLERDKDGNVESIYIADSSGPERIYLVSKNSFYESYTSKKLSNLSRGGFIPDQAVNTPIRYQPNN